MTTRTFTTDQLAPLNSATKYPSIPTYHEIDPKNGSLLENPTVFEGDVILTEKVDGTNGRIVRLPDGDWFIGSREELLYARGDRIENPALGIVPALKALAERIEGATGTDYVQVFFLEVYGHKVGGAAKQYTVSGNLGCRMFDMAFVPVEVLGWERERIASWRDGGGQWFTTEATLQRAADAEGIMLTPRLSVVQGVELPTTVEATHGWLGAVLPRTRVALDEDAGGRPEGIVLRSEDRSVIAKARFQDYERTLKRRAQSPRGR